MVFYSEYIISCNLQMLKKQKLVDFLENKESI
jgi:hypothetical protein